MISCSLCDRDISAPYSVFIRMQPGKESQVASFVSCANCDTAMLRASLCRKDIVSLRREEFQLLALRQFLPESSLVAGSLIMCRELLLRRLEALHSLRPL